MEKRTKAKFPQTRPALRRVGRRAVAQFFLPFVEAHLLALVTWSMMGMGSTVLSVVLFSLSIARLTTAGFHARTLLRYIRVCARAEQPAFGWWLVNGEGDALWSERRGRREAAIEKEHEDYKASDG